ncbi:MAG: exo-alpha-sialidase, partial [Candidatus Eisenbacteria bacterium]
MIASPARGAGGFGTPVVITGFDTGEPGIDVAPDGTIYVNTPAGLLSNGPDSPSFVFRSDDGGATWTLTPLGARADLPGGGDSDISTDPATGTLYMTDLWLGSATVSRSTDRGATWQANPLQGVVVQDRQWVASAGG